MKGLTPRQAEILQYIIDFIEDAGYPPTYREIGVQFGMMSTNAVSCHLNAIEKKGYISRDSNAQYRAISVLKSVSGDDVGLKFRNRKEWTREPPTEPGLYKVFNGEYTVVELSLDLIDDNLCIFYFGNECESSILHTEIEQWGPRIEFPLLPEKED